MYLPGKTAKMKVLMRIAPTTIKYTILKGNTHFYFLDYTSPFAKKFEQMKALIEV
jgi:hypothetical protein